MRIVIAVEGTVGDVHPMLFLSEKLLAAGHAVLLCTSPDFESDAKKRGVAFQAVGESIRAYLERHADVLHAGGLRMIDNVKDYARATLKAQFALLPDLVAGSDLVIGSGIQLGAASAAELHKIPYRVIAFCPIVFPSQFYPPLLAPWQHMSPLANRVAWLLNNAFLESTMLPPINRARHAMGLPPVANAVRYFIGESPVLAADAQLTTLPPDGPRGGVQIPALQSLAQPALPANVENFLIAGSAPIYVGFGSMPDESPRESAALVMRAAAMAKKRLVLSRGWAALAPENLTDDVLLVDSLPHTTLFARCAAVVHHGGAGTTTTAARAGVPQIVVPHLLDQFFWGARVEEHGLGVVCARRSKLTAEKLARSMLTVTETPSYATRAHDVGVRLRESAAQVDVVRALGLPC